MEDGIQIPNLLLFLHSFASKCDGAFLEMEMCFLVLWLSLCYSCLVNICIGCTSKEVCLILDVPLNSENNPSPKIPPLPPKAINP